MLIVDNNRPSTIASRLEIAPSFQLDKKAAQDIIAQQIGVIHEAWAGLCEKANLTEV